MGEDSISATWCRLSPFTSFFINQQSFVPDVAIFVADAYKAVEEGAIATTKVIFLFMLLPH